MKKKKERRKRTAWRRRLGTSLLSLLLLATGGALLAASAAAPQETLTRLEQRVRRALVTLPRYSVFDHLTFRIQGPEVTLMGAVVGPTLKSSAEKAVLGVGDIQSVENRIEVLPLSPNDDRIRMDTYRAIYYYPSFTRYAIRAVPPIHILVKNGDVTLEGVVSSEADKNVATMRARGVAGVFSVTNNLSVERD